MKEGSREQLLREMREAKLKRNSPNPFEDAARGRDPAPKVSSGSPANPDQDVARQHEHRTEKSSGRKSSGNQSAPLETKSKRGRPPKPETENVSRATLWRRRKAEEKAK